jgi:serine O-acetyltransferase
MTLREFRALVASDLYRHHDGHCSWRIVLHDLLRGTEAKFTIWLRLAAFLHGRGFLWRPLAVVATVLHRHYGIKFGLDIPWRTVIGPGFYICHCGGIVVSDQTVIGRNCNISQGVTLGVGNRGKVGAPTIGDNVYLGPGAVVYGRIRVGNHCAIGANAVVSRSLRPHSVVVPSIDVIHCRPATGVALCGSAGYVTDTDYAAIP